MKFDNLQENVTEKLMTVFGVETLAKVLTYVEEVTANGADAERLVITNIPEFITDYIVLDESENVSKSVSTEVVYPVYKDVNVPKAFVSKWGRNRMNVKQQGNLDTIEKAVLLSKYYGYDKEHEKSTYTNSLVMYSKEFDGHTVIEL